MLRMGGKAMFYNGKKTLGVFINRAELEFQQILSQSLIETAQVKNYNVWQERQYFWQMI